MILATTGSARPRTSSRSASSDPDQDRWFAGGLLLFTLLVLPACLPAPETGPPPADTGVFQAPGTRRMAERLALFADQARQEPHTFMNKERAALLERRAQSAAGNRSLQEELELARELLWAGRTQDAVARLEALRNRIGEGRPQAEHTLRAWLATAYLRLGEQQNCLEHHTVEACLLPIQGSGVHTVQQGSRAALGELTALLQQDSSDLEARWLYNLAAMTLAEYPDAVPAEWLIPPDLFASDFDLGRFEDAASSLGIGVLGLAGGSVLEDFDGDGDLDLMVSSWGIEDPLRFFDNGGDGTFSERTEEAGLAGITGGLNLVHADFDNDGWPDVLVLRGAWLPKAGRQPNSLLRNLGGGNRGSVVFEDVTEAVGLLTFHPTQTAAWGDFDNDGWLDLFVGNESFSNRSHPCQLFRNNGRSRDDDGEEGSVTFTEIATQAGVAAGGLVKGVTAGDFDNDGWIDLYLSRLREPNLLFHNRSAEGEFRFREVGGPAGVSEPLHSFPTWFFDYDNDGWLDLFASGYASEYSAAATAVAADVLGLENDAETPRLYRNRGRPASGPGDGPPVTFADVTEKAGLDHVLLAMGANFGDLDNDGFPDFYLGTGAPNLRTLIPNRMFRNDGGRRFQDVTTSGGFGHLQKGHGISFGDVDNDGDQDVFEVIGGAYSGDVYPNVLFLNPGHGHRFTTLRLEGRIANRSAIGARVRLTIDEAGVSREIHAHVGTGGSFGSSSLQQEIGLGQATIVKTLEIRWPGSGRVRVFRDLAPDRVLQIRESEHAPEGTRVGISEGTGSAVGPLSPGSR